MEIERTWSPGDAVEVSLPMGLHMYRSRNDADTVSFLYGPLVLAGALGREQFPDSDIVGNHCSLHQHPLIEVPILVTDEPDFKKWIKPVQDSPLAFVTDPIGQPSAQCVRFIPFYELHHQRYSIYWKLMNSEQFMQFDDEEKAGRDRLNAITVDVVSPHEQQSEVDHGLQAQQSRSGYSVHAQSGYREAYNGGYFSYRMAVIPDRTMQLQIKYFGRDAAQRIDGKLMEREFQILIDGNFIANQKLNGGSDQLFEVDYAIPYELTSGKRNVEIKFVAADGNWAGGVYGVRMVDRMKYEEWNA